MREEAKGPKVSFIVPVRNAETTIDTALGSILSQSYRPIELVIIDGGSTDGTLDRIRALGGRIDVLVSEPDQGIFDAMNKGIGRATGDWFIFLGADDALLGPEVVKEIFSDLPLDALESVDLIYGSGTSGGRKLKNTMNWRMIKGNSLNHQCVFYHRRVFAGQRYDTQYSVGADYKLNLWLYLEHRVALERDVLIADFGAEGLSNRERDRGLRECEAIRIELLGRFVGSTVNIARRLLSPLRCLRR